MPGTRSVPEVHGEDLHDRERKRDPEQDKGYERNDLRDVAREDIGHEFPDIGVDRPSLFDGRHDGREIVVRQDHGSRLLRHVRPPDAHGNADVRLLQRRRVVHAVPGNGNDVAQVLERGHDPHLVLGRGPCEDHFVLEQASQPLVVHLGKLPSRHDPGLLAFRKPHAPGDGERRQPVIAGDHQHPDARAAAELDGLGHLRPGRVHHSDEAQEDEVPLGVLHGEAAGVCQLPLGHGQHPKPFLCHDIVLDQDGFPFLVARAAQSRRRAGSCRRARASP